MLKQIETFKQAITYLTAGYTLTWQDETDRLCYWEVELQDHQFVYNKWNHEDSSGPEEGYSSYSIDFANAYEAKRLFVNII